MTAKIKKCMRQYIHNPKTGAIKVNPRYKDLRNVELCVINSENNKNLHLVNVKDKKRIRETGYKHLVRKSAWPHTAFRTKRGLDNWLKTTGLKKGRESSAWKGVYSLKGNYSRVSLAGNANLLDGFGKENKLKPTAVLDNGEYTRGYVEKGKRGNTIYYLNPNYQRKILKYRRP